VSEDLSPHRLTSCPDDHHLAAVRTVCSSSCLQPVIKSHINVQNSKLQETCPAPCTATTLTATGTHHLRFPQCWDCCVSTLRAANKWTVFYCPSVTLAAFCCMQFSILYYICMHHCNWHYKRHSTAIHIKTKIKKGKSVPLQTWGAQKVPGS